MGQAKKTKRGRKKKNYYFTQVHEDAILKYSASSDLKERTELYVQLIQPAINEMVDKIVYTYKFNTTLPNIHVLKEECKIWLVTILDKYDETKGSKAFSYFSVITKNWFIQKNKKNNIQKKSHIVFEDYLTSEHMKNMTVENPYMEERERHDFFSVLQEEIKTWSDTSNREAEKKVLDAIEVLFSKSDAIEIFNKKAIYLYLREITGMNTKQIVSNLNKIRQKYRTFKKDWDENG